ncbi:endogenous retrovirus group 3 member 1 Env polyprotein-like [Poecile atricapillus]|uniref:endogenous retrovirus group 3 member 1 Env polyprotein-like n=1 Tax=Poecile atricapillus TaxID=48891 RepID=UPI0027393FA0|nr:endogenous retrovirus group 3 member 1 Env polyprotein-like [Poecile atricapillus]
MKLPKMKLAHTGLLGGLILVQLVSLGIGGGGEACTKCYYPLYDGEDLGSLMRVHTNINPTCFDHTQLETCQEEGKTYWITRNTASFRQRLLGECPVGESWLCFEEEGLNDVIKEKQLRIKKGNLDETLGKNLFIDLMERISRELNLTNCWVCGNTQMSDIWPWEGISLAPLDILRWKLTEQKPQMGNRGREQWDLKTRVIGEECIKRTGKKYKTPVGKMACKRYLTVKDSGSRWIPQEPNRYWAIGRKERGCIYHEGYKLHECAEKGINPFWGLRELSKYWEHPTDTQDTFWKAPEYLFWICGSTAYTHLPGDWAGSCTIGIIKPAFFLLPKESGSYLGVPLYDNLKKGSRKRRHVIDLGSNQKWKGKIWTPEEIIKTYGPATWAQDGSWGQALPPLLLDSHMATLYPCPKLLYLVQLGPEEEDDIRTFM